jgi:CheY-like chemotaxis protein
MAEKVLLVDDDIDTLRLVGLMLQRQGYEVRLADGGQQALAMVQGEKPDLVLLDIMMPVMDGYEVARHLRADRATAEIPIIMFTAKSQVDDKVMGFEAGADDYLTKPTQPRELFAHVKAVLSRAGKPNTHSLTWAEPGEMIGIVAAKGGLGVSTTALNLGIALHEPYKKEVIVAEFRPGQGTIGLELGIKDTDGLNRLLMMKPVDITPREIEAELVSHPSGIRLLLSSPRPRDGRYLSLIENFKSIAHNIRYLSCFTILDLGPSISPLSEKVVKQCDEMLIVVEPIPQTIVQTKALITDLMSLGIKEENILIILINRVRSEINLSWSQVQDQLERPIEIIFTPAPELAYQASSNNTPIILQQSNSLSAQQFTKLAEKIAR